MIRGSYPPCGSVKLPEPIGNAWVIPTNVGEWHILTESGFYLTRLFQPDPLKVVWPESAQPGANLDNVPPGMGGEDFGGSITLARDGKLYLQAGKTAFWDLEVVGLETVKALPLGSVTIDAADLPLAGKMREDYLQAEAAIQPLVVKKRTPNFTGNLDQDFAGATMLKFQKQEDARVQATATWDDQNLYLGWDVHDATPWVNGATDRDLLYLGGDTVDFQLATDPAADPKRDEAVRGDLRLSIGPFQGKPLAVLYRRVADEKHPRSLQQRHRGGLRDGKRCAARGGRNLGQAFGPGSLRGRGQSAVGGAGLEAAARPGIARRFRRHPRRPSRPANTAADLLVESAHRHRRRRRVRIDDGAPTLGHALIYRLNLRKRCRTAKRLPGVTAAEVSCPFETVFSLPKLREFPHVASRMPLD